MSRPVRRYRITFRHDAWPESLEVDCEGTTRCEGKNDGVRLMQAHLNAHPDMPQNGWYFMSQIDRDWVSPYA